MSSFPKLSFVCPIPWAEMCGDERTRFCAKCVRTVVNLSLLTEAQRVALLAQSKPGELCVAYYRRLSGEFVSAENPPTEIEARSVVQYGVVALSLAAAAAAINYVPGASEAVVEAPQRVTTTYRTVAAEVKQFAEEAKASFTGAPPPAKQEMVMVVGMIF